MLFFFKKNKINNKIKKQINNKISASILRYGDL